MFYGFVNYKLVWCKGRWLISGNLKIARARGSTVFYEHSHAEPGSLCCFGISPFFCIMNDL